MNKIISIVLLSTCSFMVANAESKKELQDTINSLRLQNIELRAKIAEMKVENADVKMKLLNTETEIANLKKQFAQLMDSISNPLKGANADETAIFNLVYNFCAGKTWAERYKYVVPSDKVKEEMQSYYSDGCDAFKIKAESTAIISEITNALYVPILVNIGEKVPVTVVKTPNGYKIDFEKTVIYNTPSLKLLDLGQYSGTATLMLSIGSLEENNDYWWEMTGFDASSYATIYFKKDAFFAKRLVALCSDNKKHLVTLKVKYGDQNSIEVVEFVREGF